MVNGYIDREEKKIANKINEYANSCDVRILDGLFELVLEADRYPTPIDSEAKYKTKDAIKKFKENCVCHGISGRPKLLPTPKVESKVISPPRFSV